MSYFDLYDKQTEFSELAGKTLTEVRGAVGDDRMEFVCADGSIYVMYHSQDCCEGVSVESIVGDVADLLGTPILKAEEATSNENPPDAKPEDIEYQESFTWTFYKLATIKGYVDIRWYGQSNGYYSESVNFARLSGPAVSPPLPSVSPKGEMKE